jgi:hypothetical protein
MERFFQERGLLESAERMRQIRLSRQGMMAKNRMFQEVLGEYARGATLGATPSASAEAENSLAELGSGDGRTGNVDVQPAGEPANGERGSRSDTDGGVLGVAAADDGDTGIVIQE